MDIEFKNGSYTKTLVSKDSKRSPSPRVKFEELKEQEEIRKFVDKFCKAMELDLFDFQKEIMCKVVGCKEPIVFARASGYSPFRMLSMICRMLFWEDKLNDKREG